MTAPITCLGVDPGATTGWGLVRVVGRVEAALAWGELSADAPGHLRALLTEHGPDVVAFEVVGRVHPVHRKGVSGISTDQALALYRAGVVLGELRGVARANILVTEFTAETWRAALIGSPSASDAEIDRVLRLRLVATFPAPRKSTNHARDGIGVALFGALRFALELR